MKNKALWISGLRPKTLPASIAPVVVGVAAGLRTLKASQMCASGAGSLPQCFATYAGAVERPLTGTGVALFVVLALLCVVVALFLQISVNFANDYSDGVRGTDAGRGDCETKTAKPQRITASGLVPPNHVLAVAGINAAVACVAGLAIVLITGHWWLLILGVLCLLAGWFYTGGRHPYGYAGFGEVGVFLFFGLAAVLGTQYVLAGHVDVHGIIGAVLCGLFSCAILMVNNLRDVEEDRVSGKRTLGVCLGRSRARSVLFVTYLVPLVLTVVIAFLPLTMVFLESGGARFIGIVLTVIALLFAALCVKVALAMVVAVRSGNFPKALPMCSMTVLLFSVVFVIAEVSVLL
ncbi:1,4-dihydroxy-2-naphthoate octaprenyltransferase [Bifidobacterium bombi]|uniref:1,4-dihydroxy-2-naphthoate octaprenyltransferase n=1 Tax=Bifidobacterium bombi DSM 19703 TaxID=1341695 RepID=A0A080N6L2_9BIFI|nr:1,4-dihydroxy-2-naphthoate octaprenyltransferase [Bifidobacterium bombi]KFF31714.1 1,4-dihydroxy-2-naphthoate octaprenyltransferase [Bifidobacterium bombi DSM 19703]